MGLEDLPNLDELAHLATHGEPGERYRARTRLFSLLWPELVDYFHPIVRDHHAAEDLTQDTLEVVLEKLDDEHKPFVPQCDNAFVRWVSVVAKNRMLGHLASTRRRATNDQRLVAGEPEAEEPQEVVRLLLNRALARIATMTTRLREAILYVTTGEPRPIVRGDVFHGRLHRARERIRAIFGQEVRELREDNPDSEVCEETSSTA